MYSCPSASEELLQMHGGGRHIRLRDQLGSPHLPAASELCGVAVFRGKGHFLEQHTFFFSFRFSRQGCSVAFGACPGTSSWRPGWPQTHKWSAGIQGVSHHHLAIFFKKNSDKT